jgi:hypothetical protein
MAIALLNRKKSPFSSSGSESSKSKSHEYFKYSSKPRQSAESLPNRSVLEDSNTEQTAFGLRTGLFTENLPAELSGGIFT